jgi:hypothetical protein
MKSEDTQTIVKNKSKCGDGPVKILVNNWMYQLEEIKHNIHYWNQMYGAHY